MPDLRNKVISEPSVDLATVKAQDFTLIDDNVTIEVGGLGFYRYDKTSTATADDNNVIEPTVGGGRLIRLTPYTLTVNGSGLIEGSNIDLSSLDHNSLSNLTVGDVHTQYVKMDGRAGGQIVIGGTNSIDNLSLSSTSNATKGSIISDSNILFANQTFAGINFNPLTQAQRDAIASPMAGASIQNLTSGHASNYNGATWQDLAYLNDIPTSPFVTVGPTNGQFSEINLALAAGERNLYVIEDVTETANFTFSSIRDKARITVAPTATVSYGNFTPFIVTANSCTIFVSGGTHEMTRTNQSWIDTTTSFNSYIIFENCFVDDSASSSSPVYPVLVNPTTSSNINLIFRRVEFDHSDTNLAGFSGHAVFITESILRGGGTSCANIINGTACSVRNSIIEGTVSSAVDILDISVRSKIENTSLTSLGATLMSADVCVFERVRIDGGTSIDISVGNQLSLNCCAMGGADLILQSDAEINIEGSEINDIDDTLLTSAFGREQRISNSRLLADSNLGLGSDGVYLINQSVFEGSFSASLSGPNASLNMTSCRIGSPGGVETFTINAGTTNAVLIGNRSANAIVNNDPSTELFANFTL